MPAPRRDLARTRQRLASWIAARLPEAEEVRISELRGPGDTGFSTDTFLFDLCLGEAGDARRQPLAVRIAPRTRAVFPAYDLARQFRVMEALAGTDVPVPEPLWLEESPEPLGQPFLVMRQVEGRAAPDSPSYHAEGWLAEATPGEREAAWWHGLEILTRIHRLEPEALGLGFLAETTPGTGPPVQTLEYYRGYLDWVAPERRPPVMGEALARLERARPEPSARPRLCWGDARLGNMLFREGRCTAVLDWEMATLGDPESDLAWWLYFDRHHSEGSGVPRLPGIPSREATIARYEEWSGRPVRDLAWWELFAGFAFALILMRVAQKLKDLELLPPESDFEVDNTASRLLESLLEETSSRI